MELGHIYKQRNIMTTKVMKLILIGQPYHKSLWLSQPSIFTPPPGRNQKDEHLVLFNIRNNL